MGSDKQESARRRPARSSQAQNNNFVVFRPTEKQRQDIREQGLSVPVCLDALAPLLEEGHKLTLGYKSENQAYYVHMREGNAEFIDAVTISCWHSSYERCLQMMAYCVTTVYTEFPLIPPNGIHAAPDW